MLGIGRINTLPSTIETHFLGTYLLLVVTTSGGHISYLTLQADVYRKYRTSDFEVMTEQHSQHVSNKDVAL